MNNITSITPKHSRLQEINNVRAARGLSALDDLHDKWLLDLSPLLTLQDFENGSKDVQRISREQADTIDALAVPKRKAA